MKRFQLFNVLFVIGSLACQVVLRAASSSQSSSAPYRAMSSSALAECESKRSKSVPFQGKLVAQFIKKGLPSSICRMIPSSRMEEIFVLTSGSHYIAVPLDSQEHKLMLLDNAMAHGGAAFPGNTLVASRVTTEGTLLMDLDRGTLIEELPEISGHCYATLPDNKICVANDSTLCVREFESTKKLRKGDEKMREKRLLQFLNNHHLRCLPPELINIVIEYLRLRDEDHSFDLPSMGGRISLLAPLSQKRLVVGDIIGEMHLVDLETKKVVAAQKFVRGVAAISELPSGEFVATYCCELIKFK